MNDGTQCGWAELQRASRGSYLCGSTIVTLQAEHEASIDKDAAYLEVFR